MAVFTFLLAGWIFNFLQTYLEKFDLPWSFLTISLIGKCENASADLVNTSFCTFLSPVSPTLFSSAKMSNGTYLCKCFCTNMLAVPSKLRLYIIARILASDLMVSKTYHEIIVCGPWWRGLLSEITAKFRLQRNKTEEHAWIPDTRLILSRPSLLL